MLTPPLSWDHATGGQVVCYSHKSASGQVPSSLSIPGSMVGMSQHESLQCPLLSFALVNLRGLAKPSGHHGGAGPFGSLSSQTLPAAACIGTAPDDG